MELPFSLMGFYKEVFKNYKFGISLYYFFITFYKVTEYVLPTLLVKYFTDALLKKPFGELTFSDLLPTLIVFSSWIIFYIISDIMSSYVGLKTYPKTKKYAIVKLYRYLIDKSVAFYKNNSAGYLVSQAGYIVGGNGLWNIVFNYPGVFISIFLGILINFGLLFELNGIFMLIIGSVMLFRVVYSLFRFKKLSEGYVDASKSWSDVNSKNIDVLSNFLNLKIFGSSKKESSYIGNYVDDWVNKKTSVLKQELNFYAVPMTLEFLSLILILFLSSNFYLAGKMNLSEVAFLVTAFFSVRSCIIKFVWILPDVLDNYSSAKQAYKVLVKDSSNISDVQTGTKICNYKSQIAFNNVNFKYDSEWVLKDVNLCIQKGEKVGIVGRSGSGKTTLVNLLMHLYDVTSGEILIDNVNIKKFNMASLKKTITFVPQESILFDRTLAENISYGMDNATRAQIIDAAKKADAHDFIIRTEKGYDTVVGSRGVKLSGGQRQRITIAHAILKNSPILLLDEATSALDSETEEHIQNTLNKLMKNRTTIAIAHRLSTLREMDRIIVVDSGKIVESGTHEELLKNKGMYYKLWKLQYRGFM